MTWHYQITPDGSEMRVWDHTQDPATDTPLETLQNDGSGFTIPNDIKAVMRRGCENSMNLGNSPVMDQYAGHTLMDLVTNDIEEYDPE